MPHETKESTSTAASLPSDALSTIPSTASSLDARPTSPLAIVDTSSGLLVLQKPALSRFLLDDHCDPEQSAHPPLQDQMATAELSPPLAASNVRQNQEMKRKSPPLTHKKKTHFVEDFGYTEEVDTNSADSLRMKSPVIVELRTNVIVRT
jgi:hypothetical protein